MEFKDVVKYEDLINVNKIVVSKDMLSQISKYFYLNQDFVYVDYNFDCINIEVLLYSKVNIFIQRKSEEIFSVTFFSDEEKLLYFEMENVLNILFSAYDIVEYENIKKYSDTSEKLVLFVLEWYPKIIYYIEQHSLKAKSSMFEKITFFVNTPNNKFIRENKKKK